MSGRLEDLETIRVGRRVVEITHPGKALFRRPTVTKLELARYYEQIAEAMLPRARGRPLALQLFPQGTDRISVSPSARQSEHAHRRRQQPPA